MRKVYPVRNFTNLLIEAVDDGVLSADAVLRNLLGWLSEDDVRRFAEDEYSELFEEDDDDDSDDSDDDDSDDDDSDDDGDDDGDDDDGDGDDGEDDGDDDDGDEDGDGDDGEDDDDGDGDGDDDDGDEDDGDEDGDGDGDKITISITFEVVDPGGEEQDPEVVSRGFCSENDFSYPVSLDTVFTENGQVISVGSPRWAELAGADKKYSQKEGMAEIRRLLRENSGEWSSSPPRPGDGFTTHEEQDIRTGQTTSYGFHFEGLTPEQWADIQKKK
jgi:hypothetical protein